MEKKVMKALVKKYAKSGIWMDEVPVPDVGINDVLIKILKTSICGTDVHIYNLNSRIFIPMKASLLQEKYITQFAFLSFLQYDIFCQSVQSAL